MAFRFLLIFALLNLAFGGSHATLTKEELHWISVFPHTPMPKFLQDILPRPGQSFLFRGYNIAPDRKEVNDPVIGDNSHKEYKDEDSPINKGIKDVEFGAYWYDYGYKGSKKKGSTVVNAPNKKGSIVSNDEDSPINKGIKDVEFGAYWYDYGYKGSKKKESTVDNGPNKKGSIVSNDENSPINKGINDVEFGAYWYDYGYKGSKKKASTVDNAPSEKSSESKDEDSPINKGINDVEFGAYWYDYGYKGSKKKGSTVDNAPNKKGGNRRHLEEKSGHDEKSAIDQTIFFFPNSGLHPSTKVNLPRLVQKRDMATFLPQQVADSMILTTDILPQLLANLSLKAESRAAGDLKVTLLNCERAEMTGEKKYCANSLESFVDLSVSMLGKNIRLLSHELGKETKSPLFTIRKGVQNLGENSIVCHKMKYPFAVYLCHSIEKTDVLVVPLVGIDGTKAKAVVACHKDTSAWSPNHSAFRILKAKPGDGPICHFLTRDTLVWMPK